MKNSALNLFTVILLILAAAGCGKTQEGETETDFTKITNVEIFTVREESYEDYIHLPVVVSPYRLVNLGLTTGGKITKIHVDKGDRVKKGMVLLETDDVLFKAAFDIAKANLEFQEKEFARSEKLFREGSVSETVYDGSKLTLAQARGSYDQAKKQYEDATLKASFSGVVTSRNVEIGDILGPGTPAFRIIDIDRVKVQAGIPEKYIVDFKIGNNVDITFDAIPGKVFNGKINYLSPEASTSVRTFLAEIVVDNSKGDIMAGIMGDAHILRKVHDNALMVPLNALIDTQNGRILFIARDDNTAGQRSIDVGSTSDTEVMITSGLALGDRVIVKGQHDLVDGERINITGKYTPFTEEGVAQ